MGGWKAGAIVSVRDGFDCALSDFDLDVEDDDEDFFWIE